MKLIVDVPEWDYKGICKYVNDNKTVNAADYYIATGTPLTELIEDIKTDIQCVIDEDEDNGDFTDLFEALEIIDRHINEVGTSKSLPERGEE